MGTYSDLFLENLEYPEGYTISTITKPEVEVTFECGCGGQMIKTWCLPEMVQNYICEKCGEFLIKS